MTATWSSTAQGWYCGWMSSLSFLRPLSMTRAVTASMSPPNLVNDSSSRNWAWSIFSVPATFFILLIWALPPTRDTEMPTLMAGRMPRLKSAVSRNICPSVMDMTLVGMYAETSPACVSMMGSAVSEPPPLTMGLSAVGRSFIFSATAWLSMILAARSSRRECR